MVPTFFTKKYLFVAFMMPLATAVTKDKHTSVSLIAVTMKQCQLSWPEVVLGNKSFEKFIFSQYLDNVFPITLKLSQNSLHTINVAK